MAQNFVKRTDDSGSTLRKPDQRCQAEKTRIEHVEEFKSRDDIPRRATLSTHGISMAAMPTFKEATDKSSMTKLLTPFYAIFITSHIPLASTILYLLFRFLRSSEIKKVCAGISCKKTKTKTKHCQDALTLGEQGAPWVST